MKPTSVAVQTVALVYAEWAEFISLGWVHLNWNFNVKFTLFWGEWGAGFALSLRLISSSFYYCRLRMI